MPVWEKSSILSSSRRAGTAWLLLTAALAVHVAEEALTGFLDVYNPTVRSIREDFPFLPLPTFTFGLWIGGLAVAVLIFFVLSVYAFRRVRWIRPLGYFYGVVMLVNGLLHLGGPILIGRNVPGVYSSPLLLAGSLFLLWAIYKIPRPVIMP